MCHCQLGSMEMKSTSLLFIFKQSQFLGDSMRSGRRVSPPFQTFLFREKQVGLGLWAIGDFLCSQPSLQRVRAQLYLPGNVLVRDCPK